MSVVDECFERPDIAVTRLGFIYPGNPSAFGFKVVYVGDDMATLVESLRDDSSGYVRPPLTPGNLVRSYARLHYLPLLSPVDPNSKIGPATLSAESKNGVTIVGVTHADNRSETRPGAANVVSLLAQSSIGDGRNHLERVFKYGQRHPAEFVEELHTRIGDDIPAGLQIGSIAILNYPGNNLVKPYTVVNTAG